MPHPPQSWSTPATPVDTSGEGYVTARSARRGRRARPWVSALLGALVLLGQHAFTTQLSRAQVEDVPMRGAIITAETARPTPAQGNGAPLGIPRIAPPDPGPYKFLLLQPTSDAPVAYDPCRAVPYVVNERTAPPGADNLVRDAVQEIQDLTGLHFVYEGTTDEVVSGPRAPFQPDRYGDRWAPVLITWSDPMEIPDLAGDTAGLGGSTPVLTEPGGPAVYVSGIVSLDGPQVGVMFRHSYKGRLDARALVLHELAHLLGLDHVEDRGQLMHAESGTTDLQSGDLAGLAQLGAGVCVPLL